MSWLIVLLSVWVVSVVVLLSARGVVKVPGHRGLMACERLKPSGAGVPRAGGRYQILRLPAGNQSVAHWSEKLAVHTISQLQGMCGHPVPRHCSGEYQPHLLSPRVFAADLERGAAIAVAVTGQ